MGVDNFKAINDNLGHRAGDKILTTISSIITSNIRSTDFIARLGGDEFAFLLVETNENEAKIFIKKVQHELLMSMEAHAFPVTFSFGIVTFYAFTINTGEMMHMADTCMYHSKKAGKKQNQPKSGKVKNMSKLILAANRLPVTVEIKKNGEPAFSPSVGGLATGMSSLSKTYSCLWAGYSGIPIESIAQDQSDQIRNVLIDKYKAYPVPLTDQDIELYYNGFANKTIWPLFHYFPYFTSFNEETWKAYVEVNNKFYSTLKNLYEPGDIVWVHDYHLMLLPGIIRQNIPDATIGFFLHIPFPSYEVFRLLPWRKEILTGLMGSDLIGFHTFGYVRHFLSSVQRLIGIDHSMGQMNVENRTVKCDTFPMGIDYQRYSDYMHNKKIVREITGFKDSMTGKKLILSMDRLDFTKGIIERLNSFERFLEKYPGYHGKVQMTIVTVPSRTQVDTYIKLRKTINSMSAGSTGNTIPSAGRRYSISTGPSPLR
jgi:trehalose 6-phosphate synthase/phosphatase